MAFTKINAAGIGTTETVTVDGLTVINDGSFGGNLSVGGTITYEDVTNVDSVGLITARNGIVVGSGITLSKDGDIFATGVTTTGSLVSSGAISGTTGNFSSNVDIAGELTVAETIAHTGDTNNKISFPSADTITLTTSGSERARIDSSGRVRIGCTAQPSTTVSGSQFDAGGKTLRISEGGGTSSTTGASVQITGGGGNTSIGAAAAIGAVLSLTNCNNTDNNQTSIDFSASSGLAVAKVIGKNDSHSSRNGSLIFATSSGAAPAERVRIDSSGRVLIGTTTEGNASGDNLTIAATDGEACGITLRSDTDEGGRIFFSDGTSGADEYRGVVGYSHGTNHMYFSTDASEAVRIDSDGRVLIGDTDADNSWSGGDSVVIGNTSSGTRTGVTLVSANDQDGGIYFSDGTSSGNANVQGQIVYDHANSYMRLYTSASERVRIDTSGNVYIGNASYGNSLGQLRVINDASSSPASLALFGYGNTTDNDPFGQIQFAEQEAGTGGQIKAKIEAQAVSTNERGSNLVFFTSANTSSSTPQERLRITEDGYVLKNNHPAFGARQLSNASTNAAVDSAGTAIFSSVFLNSGSHYNNSTGVFTCPVAGIYHFSCTMLVDDNASTNATYYVDIRKNGSQVTRLGYDFRKNVSTGAYHPYMAGSVTLSAAADDEITIYMNAGGFHVGGEANFSGHLIG